jgi:hypothetical protein
LLLLLVAHVSLTHAALALALIALIHISSLELSLAIEFVILSFSWDFSQ